jgi:hypothetical protein
MKSGCLAELVKAVDLSPTEEILAGSNPAASTYFKNKKDI